MSAPQMALPSAGVKLSAIAELTIRPFTAFGGCLSCSSKGSFRSPILRRGMNTPDVPGCVERDTDHPVVASPYRNTVGHASGRAFSGGEFIQEDLRSRLEWA